MAFQVEVILLFAAICEHPIEGNRSGLYWPLSGLTGSLEAVGLLYMDF